MTRFEWDEEKSWSNKIKHGVRFEEAQVIWEDENSTEFYDIFHSGQEHRFIRIGLNSMRGLLIVVFCEVFEEVIRIISARKATPGESKIYARRI